MGIHSRSSGVVGAAGNRGRDETDDRGREQTEQVQLYNSISALESSLPMEQSLNLEREQRQPLDNENAIPNLDLDLTNNQLDDDQE
jgi:hypothetical protein